MSWWRLVKVKGLLKAGRAYSNPVDSRGRRTTTKQRPPLQTRQLRRGAERKVGFRRPFAGGLYLGHERHFVSVSLDGQAPVDGLFCSFHARPVAAVGDSQVRDKVRELALERRKVRKRSVDQRRQGSDRIWMFWCEPEDIVTEPCCVRQREIERLDASKEVFESGQDSHVNLVRRHEWEEHGEMCRNT